MIPVINFVLTNLDDHPGIWVTTRSKLVFNSLPVALSSIARNPVTAHAQVVRVLSR